MKLLKIYTLYIEVTHACNQCCKHCYLNCNNKQPFMIMSTMQIKRIIDLFKNQGGRHIIITGGEPLIRKDIFEILDYIEHLKISFDFASNGLAMNEDRLKMLASYKYLNYYFTSILGANKDKHSFISNKDSFENVLKSIAFFDSKNIKSYVQVTLAKDYLDDIDQIINLLLPYKKCIIKLTPIASFGVKSQNECMQNKELLVPSNMYDYFKTKIKPWINECPSRFDRANVMNYQDIEEMINDCINEELYSLSYGFIAIRPNGDISFSTNLGNPIVFGKAYESLSIPIDNKILEYVNLLKKMDQYILNKAKTCLLEYDVECDNFIAHSKNNFI